MQTAVNSLETEPKEERRQTGAEVALRAIAVQPAPDSAALHALGLSAMLEKNFALAASKFAQAIQLAGPLPQYCENLARALHAGGQLRQSAACYEQAIAGSPDNVRLYLSLARVLIQDDRAAAAATLLKQTLVLKPHTAEAWALLGGALNLCGQPAQAAEALQQAVSLDSKCAAFHYDLGLVLSRLGNLEKSETSYRHALQINPRFPEALNNLGNLLHRRRASSEAVACFRRALRHRPDYADARYNLGLALQSLDLLDDAEDCYRRVLERAPQHHAASNNYANVLMGLGRIPEALSRYQHAVRLAPANREYRINAGLAQLLKGDFREGWRNYGARVSPSVPGARLWNGEHLEGSTILLSSEQGLGDTIQFIRFARHLRAEGGRVHASCPAALVDLLRTVTDLSDVIPDTDPAPPCDWYAPLLHLPAVFGIRPGTIPAQIPYLFADPARVRDWELLLRTSRRASTQLRVGIAWRGGPDHWNDRHRSLNPSLLNAFQDVPSTAFFSLQKGYREGCDGLDFTPLPRDLTDFADTAALMMHLDLVISVDTSVAHLAGALGRPAWVLLPYAPDWRWLLGRNDSPWYPGMRLFRQPRRGEWRPVLDEVRESLLALSGQ